MMKFFKSMVSAIRGGEQAERDENAKRDEYYGRFPSRAFRQAKTEADKERVKRREAAKLDYLSAMQGSELNVMFERSPKQEAAILRNVADQIEKAADRQGVIELNRARVQHRAAEVTFLGWKPKENLAMRAGWIEAYRARAAARQDAQTDQPQRMSALDKWKAENAAKPKPAPDTTPTPTQRRRIKP